MTASPLTEHEKMQRIKVLQAAKQREREECVHSWKIPWTGCAYQQCRKCGARELDD